MGCSATQRCDLSKSSAVGGRLGREAGVPDDGQAHFQNVLGKDGVQAQLNHYIANRWQFEAHRATVMEAHANGTWFTVPETSELKLLPKAALQQLWVFHEVRKSTEAEDFGKVALVVVTTDVAVNIYNKAASHGLPAVRLL